MAILSLFEKFQSLSGFQVRCNFGRLTLDWRILTGFNPYRVFKFVATRAPWGSGRTWGSFNPYRVFKFVATSSYMPLWMTVPTSFNPYRVFKFVATHILQGDRAIHIIVSIPIGFSSSLQLLRCAPCQHAVLPFQSLSGFQVRCNGLCRGL